MSPFSPPPDWLRLRTLDLHTCGEPLRIVLDGFPELPGATILERRRLARERWDHLRRLLMLEPRGHADMYGALPLPSATPDGDLGVLFLHNAGWSTMCGHGIIGLVTGGLDAGLFALPPGRGDLRIDTPAGRVTATPRIGGGGRVESVSFRNVPSFLAAAGIEVEAPGVGRVRGDLAFGGAFYFYVEASSVGLRLVPEEYPRIVDLGRRLKAACRARQPIRHPAGETDLDFLYGVIFTARPAAAAAPWREVCVFADGEVDRSPTGTGVSGLAAILHARGELPVGRTLRVESLIGTAFAVTVAETVRVGGRSAVVPEVEGRAWITGRHEFLLDPSDPLPDGFLLR
ncbi:MAG: proline racemase [Planctomycetota bacterium]|nr:MAG: proline racemase [Planctomycetota bacterium]